MNRLRRARAPVHASFTKTVNDLRRELEAENSDNAVIQAKMSKLEATCHELQTLDDQMKEIMLDEDCSAEEILSEREGMDKYGDEWFEICVRVKTTSSMSRPMSPTPSDQSSSTAMKRTFKLPKIELRKFNGDLTEWLGWWSQFSKIHENEDLHDSDKFQYLVQSMTVGTRARDLVESYSQTVKNYPKVILALTDRFGKPKLLKQVYVRELLKMIMQNAKSKEKVPLSKMYDRLESHLRALESLGVTAEQTAEFLFPMVESSLPEDVLVAWQRSSFYGRDGSKENSVKSELDFLMDFLRQEVENEGQRTLAKSGFESSSKDRKDVKQVTIRKKEEMLPTAAGLFSGQSQLCAFCEKQHPSQDCYKAQTMSLAEKKNKLKEKRCCFCCLRSGHMAKFCKSVLSCYVCHKKHPTLLCPDLPCHKKTEGKQVFEEKSTKAMSSHHNNGEVPLQTLLVRIFSQDGKRRYVARLVYDNGSQGTSVLLDSVQKLKLKPLGEVWLRRSLYGGNVTDLKKHNKYKLRLESLDGKIQLDIIALDEDRICGPISRVPKGPWIKELRDKNIFLSDVESENPEIEILVGNDYYGQLLTGTVHHLDCGLTAIGTVFGWTLSGKIPSVRDSSAMMVRSMWASHAIPAELWSLESLEIRDPVEHKTKEQKEALVTEHFMKNVTQNKDGRYSVSLPWMGEGYRIPDNRLNAQKRLESMTAKLVSAGKYQDYEAIFMEWLQLGIIVEVIEQDVDRVAHYLPHRAVFKPQSLTTPVRPVFDASCKSKREPSLNDCLEKGPNLMELIPSILLRFRQGKIGVISDIKKAFLQIWIKEVDRDFLRFLWWSDPKQKTVKVFRHNRVVFGVNCSPFLLAAVIEHHLTRIDDTGTFEQKSIADQLLKSLYVDNCVTSVDTVEQLKLFKVQSTIMMSEAKMELRQWE